MGPHPIHTSVASTTHQEAGESVKVHRFGLPLPVWDVLTDEHYVVPTSPGGHIGYYEDWTAANATEWLMDLPEFTGPYWSAVIAEDHVARETSAKRLAVYAADFPDEVSKVFAVSDVAADYACLPLVLEKSAGQLAMGALPGLLDAFAFAQRNFRELAKPSLDGLAL